MSSQLFARPMVLLVWLMVVCPVALGMTKANRLRYLDEPDPYYVGRGFARLSTPQWIGEEGVGAVVILSIDDMRGHEKWEQYLRPLIERLKQFDGRAPVSIMTCQIDPAHPHLQTWLAEGLSLETHTFDHPCPLLADGDFNKAKATYERCIDLLADVPGSRPVAFRMPCCDSRNTLSPRFFAEMFNRTTPRGNYLAIDSSVFCILTSNDPALPRELVQESDGRERFRKYLPFDSFVNTIEDYPYPYVIGRLAWEFPCIVPSDWQAQNLQRPNNPRSVADMQAALDAVVEKQGVFDLVFHPHGWIRAGQIVELVDHAVRRHGQRVRFLNFREALDRLNTHLLAGHPLRAEDGGDNGVRLIDLNNDGYLDVIIGNEQAKVTRVWSPDDGSWHETEFPFALVQVDADGRRRETGARLGIVRDDGLPSAIVRNEDFAGAWHFDGRQWIAAPELLDGLEVDGQSVLTAANGIDRGVRLADLDGSGRCELIVANPEQRAVFHWSVSDAQWQRLPFELPDGALLADDAGHDRGLRLIDVDDDLDLDLLFSNEREYGLYLFDSLETGWSQRVLAARRSDANEIPMIVRGTTNNGAWFHSRHLWVQNENTAKLPDLVDRRSFNDLLEGTKPQPKSPEASLTALKARDGFRVELVAAEPLVADPVDFDWSADGKLYVAEMGDYPLGTKDPSQGGRVRCLIDDDGDGRYDRATVLLDGLSYPNSVAAWRGGVLVMAAPDILYAEDTNGDGRADKREVLFTGIRTSNPQHRANGLVRGLDGWFYCAGSDHRGKITSAAGEEFDVGGRDFRIHPDRGLVEPLLGNTQFIRSRDDWDNWFGNNNIRPMYQFMLEDRYLKRNPHVAPPDAVREVPVNPGSAPVFPRSRTLERFNDLHTADRFTSACSSIVYRDELLGPHVAGNMFVVEPVHNLVHREIMRPRSLEFKSRRAADEQQSEFLASTDNWFRPVRVRTGPDGALWVADMYRQVIEHPEWIPPSAIRELDVRGGSRMGRIYRVLPVATAARAIPNLADLSGAELVEMLESPNGWVRDMSQQLLVERADRSTASALAEMVAGGRRPTARLHALCTLDVCGWLETETIATALGDDHPGVRRHGIRVAEPRLDASPELVEHVLPLIDDKDPHVRLQLAYSLGQSSDPRAGRALGVLALTSGDDPFQTAAVMSSAMAHLDRVIEAILGSTNPPPRDSVVINLLATAMGTENDAALAALLRGIGRSSDGTFDAWQIAACGGWLNLLDRRSQTLSQRRDAADSDLREAIDSLAPLFAFARRAAADADLADDQRAACIALLARDEAARGADLKLLYLLLGPEHPGSVQQAALAALARQGDEATPGELMARFRSYTPAMRGELLSIALRRSEWLAALLASIEASQIAPRDLDATQRQQLLAHRDETVRQRAAQLLVEETSTDRRELLKQYAAVADLTGDPVLGAAVFEKRCSVCHRFQDRGHAIGPDLAALTDKSTEALMTAVLDPNRAVEARYVSYTAVTTEGLTFTGLLVSETAASITLLGQEGKEQVILRSELEVLESSGKSLMPEGLEKDISPEEMAACFAYLREGTPQPKQVPGNRPEVVRHEALRGELACLSSNCEIYGATLRIEEVNGALGWWNSENDHAVWEIEVTRPGRYVVLLEWSCVDSCAGNTYVLEVAGQRLRGTVKSTGDWNYYRRESIGYVELPEGRSRLGVRAEGKIQEALFDLKSVTLRPAPQ